MKLIKDLFRPAVIGILMLFFGAYFGVGFSKKGFFIITVICFTVAIAGLFIAIAECMKREEQ